MIENDCGVELSYSSCFAAYMGAQDAVKKGDLLWKDIANGIISRWKLSV